MEANGGNPAYHWVWSRLKSSVIDAALAAGLREFLGGNVDREQQGVMAESSCRQTTITHSLQVVGQCFELEDTS